MLALGLWAALAALGVLFLIFLAGLSSALLEARRERNAGLPVSRPAWEAWEARRASGGALASVRGYWKGYTTDRGRASVHRAAETTRAPEPVPLCERVDYDDH